MRDKTEECEFFLEIANAGANDQVMINKRISVIDIEDIEPL